MLDTLFVMFFRVLPILCYYCDCSASHIITIPHNRIHAECNLYTICCESIGYKSSRFHTSPCHDRVYFFHAEGTRSFPAPKNRLRLTDLGGWRYRWRRPAVTGSTGDVLVGTDDVRINPSQMRTGWWFGASFIFPYIWNSHPKWLSYFFRGVQTTNLRTYGAGILTYIDLQN